jgi:signal transduction histidine kinase
MHFVKPAWLNSIGLKVLLAYVIGVMLSIVLSALLAFGLLFTQSRHFAVHDVTELSQNFSEHVQFNAGKPVGFDSVLSQFAWMFDSMKKEVAFRILDNTGQTFLVSGAGEDFWQKSDPTYKQMPGGFSFSHQDITMHAATVMFNQEQQSWYFQLAVSERLHYLLHQWIGIRFMGAGIVWFSLVLLVVFGICGYITLKYTLKPLRRVSESAATISPRSIHARLHDEKVPYEIIPLVKSFNHVLDRLEHGYRLQQEFLTTAAHELKTPLALIRAQIELNETGEDRNALLKDVEHMSRQVQQLLLLAEVSEQQHYHFSEVNIEEVVNEVVTFLQPMTKRANVQIMVAHILDANWQADRSALFILLKNLLENAIQHASANSEIKVEITENQISVRDWGPGISEEDLPKIFTRFWRGSHRRDHGAGLGMTICQEIAQAHNWKLSANRVEPGLCFNLSRPLISSRGASSK